MKDARGMLMATYSLDPAVSNGHLRTIEFDKYDSDLLGTVSVNVDVQIAAVTVSTFTRGETQYMLSDHRSNNMAAVSDKILQHTTNNNTVDYFTADVLTASSYSAYGAIAKSFNGQNIDKAFNGQKRSKEISESAQTAEFWEYDGDIGRRWNLDPISTVDISDYSVFGNNPISNVDPNGAYFFGWLGSTSEQRKAAKAFAKQTDGKVNNITRKSINVTWAFATKDNAGVGKTGFYNDGFAKVFGKTAHSDFLLQSFNAKYGGKYDESTGRYGRPGPISGRTEMADDPITVLGPGLIRGLVGRLTLAAAEKAIEKTTLSIVEDVAEKELPKLLAPSISIAEKGLLHTLERHTINGLAKWARKSKFLVSSEDAIKDLVQKAAQLPGIRQANGNFQRIVDAGKDIGIDMATKKSTSIYTVITDASNNLITAFPGVPGR